MVQYRRSDLIDLLTVRYPSRARPVGFYPLPYDDISLYRKGDVLRPYNVTQSRRGLIYIHVPFCRQRCGFCRFYPGSYTDDSADVFVRGVVKEAAYWGRLRARDVYTGPIEAVFLGGGSPSALSVDCLGRIFDALKDSFPFTPRTEITMEWYPKDSDIEKLMAVRELGVNRLSFGIQSWDQDIIKRMGGHHTPYETETCIEFAIKTGHDNFNLDLLMNIPGQQLNQAVADVEKALSWQPNMLSINQLELAQWTPMARRQIEDNDNEKRTWLNVVSEKLVSNGYRHQRIRNLGKQNYIHRYNRATIGIGYDIVPLGPSSYGFVSGWSTINEVDLKKWADHLDAGRLALARVGPPSDDEMKRGYAVSSLLELHVDIQQYRTQFNSEFTADFPFVEELIAMGALEIAGPLLTLNDEAIQFGDDICLEFFSEPQRGMFSNHLVKFDRTRYSQYSPPSNSNFGLQK